MFLAMFLFASTVFARSPQVLQGAGSESIVSISVSELPAEARHTLTLIRQGGPFPYPKDGVVFGNRERILPKHSRGYYHEYTVRTPGSRDRGARRLIVGGSPMSSDEVYFTADHYASFRRIVE